MMGVSAPFEIAHHRLDIGIVVRWISGLVDEHLVFQASRLQQRTVNVVERFVSRCEVWHEYRKAVAVQNLLLVLHLSRGIGSTAPPLNA